MDWTQTMQKYPEANFLQSPVWGRVNELVGHKVIIEETANYWCQMIVRSAWWPVGRLEEP